LPLLWFFPVPPCKYYGITPNHATIPSLNIISNSLLSNHHIIHHYIIQNFTKYKCKIRGFNSCGLLNCNTTQCGNDNLFNINNCHTGPIGQFSWKQPNSACQQLLKNVQNNIQDNVQ
jgi:hypothetical protein